MIYIATCSVIGRFADLARLIHQRAPERLASVV
jgi:hypothetical protein